MTRIPTTWILIVTIAALLIVEAYALINKHPGDTISEVVWQASQRPLVPFLAGLLCGHFFWQRVG